MDHGSQMIRDIRNRYGFNDEVVLSALEKVSRHEFVDVNEIEAYSDKPISIGHGQTISQPYTVASMTHLLIRGGDSETLRQVQGVNDWRVLEIGTGSGYQAAVLAELVKEVYTVEIIPELAKKAKRTLRRLGYKNVHVKKGSGELGWKKYAPYDAIMITAALEKNVPEALIEQLKAEGIIVAPIGTRELQTMTRFTKKKSGKLIKEQFDNFVFVPFIEEQD